MPQGRTTRLIGRLFPPKIAVKLALVISVLVCILISFLGLVLTRMTEDMLKVKASVTNEEIAKRAAREISLFVNRPVELLETAAQLISLDKKNAWEQETVLVELSLHFPLFQEIISVDGEGAQVASSNPGRPKKFLSGEDSFQSALKGETYVSPIRIESDHLPHITVAVPYEHAGQIFGVLITDVNLRGLWDIVDGIHFGKTGHAFLVSSEGLLIAHADKKLVFRNMNFSSYPAFEQLLSGKTKTIEYLSADEKTYLASYAPVYGPLAIDVVTELEKREAYSVLDYMRVFIWSVLLFSLLISIGVSILVAKWFVRPIRELTEWSKKISSGNFDYQARPRSLDELGRLFLVFRRMSERLRLARGKEHLAALGVAASTIAHKLKNSIVALKTYAELFPHRRKDEHFMQKFERVFDASVHHLESMFQNLSQVTAERKVNFEPVSLPELFERAQMAYAEEMAKANIQFCLDQSSTLSLVSGDRELLYELLVNLIQNAIQAMPHGGKLTLSASYASRKTDHPMIRISVEDTGIGIPTEALSQIFKPFFTTKHNGMGLGLTICKKIVEDHGGIIEATSVEKVGSVFTTFLPVAKKKEIEIQTPSHLGL